jgi:hypothetical protein
MINRLRGPRADNAAAADDCSGNAPLAVASVLLPEAAERATVISSWRWAPIRRRDLWPSCLMAKLRDRPNT